MSGITKATEIKISAEKLTHSLKQIETRRSEWINTKTRLINVLTFIQKEYNFDWSVQRLEDIQNLQTINIKFNSSNSGIIEKKQEPNKTTTVKAYVKYGGYLAFMQTYNSQVAIIITYPHIEEWVDEAEPKDLGWYEPEEITEEFVLEKVNIFLEEMWKWENHNISTKDETKKPYTPVGYKLPSTE